MNLGKGMFLYRFQIAQEEPIHITEAFRFIGLGLRWTKTTYELEKQFDDSADMSDLDIEEA